MLNVLHLDAVTITPSRPLTVFDLPRVEKSNTYAYSSYFRDWVVPLSKKIT